MPSNNYRTHAFLATVLALLIFLPALAWAEDLETRTIKLAVISDVHYVDPDGVPTSEQGIAAFTHAESAELRLMR